jgi:hypothetical protein
MIDEKDIIVGGFYRDTYNRIWLHNEKKGTWSYKGIKELRHTPPPNLIERIS